MLLRAVGALILVSGLPLLCSKVILSFRIVTFFISSFRNLIRWFAERRLVCTCVARKSSHISTDCFLLGSAMRFYLGESCPRARLHVVVHIVLEFILFIVESRVVRLFVWRISFLLVPTLRPLAILFLVGVFGVFYIFLAAVAASTRAGWTFCFCRVLIFNSFSRQIWPGIILILISFYLWLCASSKPMYCILVIVRPLRDPVVA